MRRQESIQNCWRNRSGPCKYLIEKRADFSPILFLEKQVSLDGGSDERERLSVLWWHSSGLQIRGHGRPLHVLRPERPAACP